jgi:hypothetical protein
MCLAVDGAPKDEAWRRMTLIARQLRSEKVGEIADDFPEIMTAAQLEKMQFQPLEWTILGILPVGTTLLAGPPKAGKTRLVTHIASRIVNGSRVLGKIDTEPQGVLMLYLEDGGRRVRGRLLDMLPDGWPKNLTFTTQWERMTKGGLQKLDKFLARHAWVRFVVVDIFARIRPFSSPIRSVYERDYHEVSLIKKIADEHDVGIMLLHHTNKLKDAPDVFERISGSQGLAAAADTIMLLDRENRLEAKAVLSIDGRDVEAQELALEHDLDTGEWLLLGEANLYQTSESRRAIIEYLKENPAKTPSEVAKALNMNPSTVRTTMQKMADAGQLVKDDKSRYFVLGKW